MTLCGASLFSIVGHQCLGLVLPYMGWIAEKAKADVTKFVETWNLRVLHWTLPAVSAVAFHHGAEPDTRTAWAPLVFVTSQCVTVLCGKQHAKSRSLSLGGITSQEQLATIVLPLAFTILSQYSSQPLVVLIANTVTTIGSSLLSIALVHAAGVADAVAICHGCRV